MLPTLYARHEPSRYHSRRYDVVLYLDREATQPKCRYITGMYKLPKPTDKNWMVAGYVRQLEWLPDLKHTRKRA